MIPKNRTNKVFPHPQRVWPLTTDISEDLCQISLFDELADDELSDLKCMGGEIRNLPHGIQVELTN